MNSYFPIERRDTLRAKGYLYVSIAWGMGAFALWLYANQQTVFINYIYAMWMYLALTKLLGFIGWKEYARSKGYSWAFGLFSFVPALGPGFLLFLDDKWMDQEPPELKVKKYQW